VIYKICDAVLKVMRPILHYIPPIYGPQTLLLTLPEHLSSLPVFSKVYVTMDERKNDKKTNNDLQNTTQKNED
jgi:hypothetical protein